MSNQSYDQRVKDVLDRVAKGHLSPDEATTLIAAIKGPDTTGADEPAAQPPVAETVDDTPSASVWADAVDAPDAADQPVAKHAATSNGVQDSVVDEAPAEAEQPVAVEEPAVEDEAEEVEEEHSNVPIPSGVQRVTVRAIGRRVRLIGEPAIGGVAVDGPHVIKRDGDTLAISSEGDMGVSIDGFSMLRNPTNLKSHVNGLAKELSIRVNPSLQVEVEVTGGSVNAERLPGLTRVRVTAGTAKVTDVDGPIDVLVQAGSATLDAQITKGRSRVRVESGTANVSLRRGSDVRVHTEAQLGRVTWTGAVSGQSKDVEIGRGRAALDVEVLVGTAQIASD
ncbi:hypothetical protein AB0L70_33070 [Kribbella sp. NPDC051952]|uniref:hypothetical protein n=1 Tax=Kribbella sp. NPDC051952 TaxID=3154851 RepID=UPI00343CB553